MHEDSNWPSLMGENCDWQVNVVKGLKLYEDIFTASELCRLSNFIDELRAAGQNGELPGELPSVVAMNKRASLHAACEFFNRTNTCNYVGRLLI